MACGCSKNRRRLLGRPVAVPEDGGAIKASSSSGSWTTTCAAEGETFRSLLAAQRAAAECGGRVIPA